MRITAKKQSQMLGYNALVNMAGLILRGVIGLFLIFFLMMNLGDVLFGIWQSLGGFFIYAGTMQIGMNSAVSFMVPRWRRR